LSLGASQQYYAYKREGFVGSNPTAPTRKRVDGRAGSGGRLPQLTITADSSLSAEQAIELAERIPAGDLIDVRIDLPLLADM
jgi:hypothetical protein